MKLRSLRHYATNATASPGSDDPPTSIGTTEQVSHPSVPAPIFRRKGRFHKACWNVRTLRDEGTQALTTRVLLAYRVDVACLSTVRLSGSGHTPIAVTQQDTTCHLYHSRTADNAGQNGIAIALSAAANSSLLDWAPFASSLAKVRLKGETAHVSIIAVYMPTLDADDIVKAAFFSQIQAIVDEVPTGDILVVAGDWNACTGPADNTAQ